MKNFSVICMLFLALCSCSNHSNRQAAVEIVQSWMGKEIKFPDDWRLNAYISDTAIDYNFTESDYAVVSYFDSIGCMSCKMNLSGWASFIEQLDTVTKDFVPCIFILNPGNGQKLELIKYLEHVRFNYPVYIDEKDSFNLLNRFPTKAYYQTFLIDRNRKVLAVGDPTKNPSIKRLFLQMIEGKDISGGNIEVMKTVVDMDRVSASLGSFDWQTEQKVTFPIKNVGNNRLIIEHVSTSCGCISVTYSKEPVLPGEIINLEVTYKAEKSEYFNKTISVYCNAETSPIILDINGNAR